MFGKKYKQQAHMIAVLFVFSFKQPHTSRKTKTSTHQRTDQLNTVFCLLCFVCLVFNVFCVCSLCALCRASYVTHSTLMRHMRNDKWRLHVVLNAPNDIRIEDVWFVQCDTVMYNVMFVPVHVMLLSDTRKKGKDHLLYLLLLLTFPPVKDSRVTVKPKRANSHRFQLIDPSYGFVTENIKWKNWKFYITHLVDMFLSQKV